MCCFADGATRVCNGRPPDSHLRRKGWFFVLTTRKSTIAETLGESRIIELYTKLDGIAMELQSRTGAKLLRNWLANTVATKLFSYGIERCC